MIEETAVQVDHPRLDIGRHPRGPGKRRQEYGMLVTVSYPVFQCLQGVRHRKNGSLLEVPMDPADKFLGLHLLRITGGDDFGQLLPDLRVIRLNEGG